MSNEFTPQEPEQQELASMDAPLQPSAPTTQEASEPAPDTVASAAKPLPSVAPMPQDSRNNPYHAVHLAALEAEKAVAESTYSEGLGKRL